MEGANSKMLQIQLTMAASSSKMLQIGMRTSRKQIPKRKTIVSKTFLILVDDFGVLKIGVCVCVAQVEVLTAVGDMTLRWEPLQRTKNTERKKTWPKRTGMKSMQKAPAARCVRGKFHWSMGEVSPTVSPGWEWWQYGEHDEHTNVVLRCFMLVALEQKLMFCVSTTVRLSGMVGPTPIMLGNRRSYASCVSLL